MDDPPPWAVGCFLLLILGLVAFGYATRVFDLGA